MNSALKILQSLVIALIGLAAARGVQAQQVVRLLEFTNVWKFNDTGADLGTAWREPAYDDSAWPSGPGMFGVETNLPPPYPIPIQTPMALGTVVTYYLRTHFQYDGSLTITGTVVRARLFLDDGCAVYLNGVEAGRIGTFSSSPEGSLEWFEFPPDLMLTGDNVLAVEVHQINVPNVDVVFGMRLDAMVPEPLVITRQPLNQTSLLGSSAFFRVDLVGGPASFQWKKDGTNLPNAQFQFLTIPTTTLSDAGDYSVAVSNVLGEIASAPANLAVIVQDFNTNGPPEMVSATVRIAAGVISNIVDVKFSEPLLLTPTIPGQFVDHGGFQISEAESLAIVPIFRAQYASPVVRLTLAESLVATKSYILTVNNLQDLSGNMIAPNSQVGVSWPVSLTLVGSNSLWRYHTFATQDVSVLDAKWYEPSYVESPYWVEEITSTPRPYQKQAALFRIPFVRPESPAVIEKMVLAFDTLPYPVFWLNGDEIYRYPIASDFPAWPTPVDVNTRSYRIGGGSNQISIPIAMLMPGTNWLAAGVFHHVDGGYDPPSTGPSRFHATLAINYLLTADLPESPPPQLMATQLSPSHYGLSWTGNGYALETATNIVTVGTNTTIGPWFPVPDMANPYTVTVNPDEPLRLFRLRK